MNAQTRPRTHRTQNLQSKATKTFHATKVLRKERKTISWEGLKYINQLKSILTGKCRDSKAESESDSLQVVQTSYAWRSDSKITFQRFANGIKVSYRNASSKIYSEFIYVEGYEVRVSVYFVK